MVFHVAKQLLNCMYTPTSYGDIRNTSSTIPSTEFSRTLQKVNTIDYIQAIMKTTLVIMLLAVAVTCCYAAAVNHDSHCDKLDLPEYPGQ